MVGQFDMLLPGRLIREMLLLAEIESDPAISQNRMAGKVGLAPSMVNGYIRKMAEQGLLNKSGSNNRCITYHLTRTGRARRDELMRRYTIETVRLYKYAKHEFRRRLAQLFGGRSGLRIALFGAAETGELVCQLCLELGNEVVGVVDSDGCRQGRTLFGRPVTDPSSLASMAADLVLITSLGHADEILKSLETLRRKGLEVCSVGLSGPPEEVA